MRTLSDNGVEIVQNACFIQLRLGFRRFILYILGSKKSKLASTLHLLLYRLEAGERIVDFYNIHHIGGTVRTQCYDKISWVSPDR